MRLVVWMGLLAACDSGRPAKTPPAPRPAPPPADARLFPDAEIIEGDPIENAVNAAFAGHVPTLPALSADGTHAAIDRSEWRGESSIHDYKVGLIDTKGVLSKPWVVLDAKLGEALLQEDPPSLPISELSAAARKVTTELAGYTPFAPTVEVPLVEGGHSELSVGTTLLIADRVEDKRLTLRWRDANGVVLRQETIAASPREEREGGRCGGTPRVVSLWFAPPRRLLIEIVFPGSDSCSDEPVQWRLW